MVPRKQYLFSIEKVSWRYDVALTVCRGGLPKKLRGGTLKPARVKLTIGKFVGGRGGPGSDSVGIKMLQRTKNPTVHNTCALNTACRSTGRFDHLPNVFSKKIWSW